MKIFVSHAIKDKALLSQFKATLEPHGITLLIAEHYKNLQGTITEKIEGMIDSCDVALILLTKSGFNSMFVQQEIGYIKRANKPFLQIIQIGLEKKISGFTYGRGYIPLDSSNTDFALKKVRNTLLKYWREKEKAKIQKKFEKQRKLVRQRQIERQKRQQMMNSIVLFASIIILVAVLSTNK
jgi:hypothetical protein